MSNYTFGTGKDDLLGGQPRFLYGLRRTDEGELFLVRVDQLSRTDAVQINLPGPDEDNFDNFEVGVDFFEGRDVFHELVYDNLNYEQYRWDDRSLYYYINDAGELVIRVGAKYNYPAGI
jgi:hypothetical protein